MTNGNDVGITLAVIASVSGAVGNLLFRLSWKAKRLRRAIRFGGLCTVVAADPARILSFGYGDSAVVAPFSSLSLVWLILLANPIAGDKPNRSETIGALVIASGVAIIAAFGAGGGGGSGSGGGDDDDAFNLGDDGNSRDRLDAVLSAFMHNVQRPAFVSYLIAEAVFLVVASATVSTLPPERLVAKVFWGGIGGVLQGNVYFLKAASTMAVIDFGEACTLTGFWVLTVSFIVIAATGLLVNALAMRFYKATFCVCSFVGWYNVSAAASSAAFFGVSGQDSSAVGLGLYLTGMAAIVGGVVLLIAVSIGEAMKDDDDDDDDDDGGGGEGEGGGDSGRAPSLTEFVSEAVLRPSLGRHRPRTTSRDQREKHNNNNADHERDSAGLYAALIDGCSVVLDDGDDGGRDPGGSSSPRGFQSSSSSPSRGSRSRSADATYSSDLLGGAVRNSSSSSSSANARDSSDLFGGAVRNTKTTGGALV